MQKTVTVSVRVCEVHVLVHQYFTSIPCGNIHFTQINITKYTLKYGILNLKWKTQWSLILSSSFSLVLFSMTLNIHDQIWKKNQVRNQVFHYKGFYKEKNPVKLNPSHHVQFGKFSYKWLCCCCQRSSDQFKRCQINLSVFHAVLFFPRWHTAMGFNKDGFSRARGNCTVMEYIYIWATGCSTVKDVAKNLDVAKFIF